MVNADTFLTTVYVMVDDVLATVPDAPTPGPAPALSRSEVVTLALCAQWRPCASERAFYRYAKAHLRGAFPTLPARSQYNRLLRRCHDSIVALGQQVAQALDATTCAYEVLDGTGVPTRNAKRRGSGWLAGQAAVGRCTRLGWYNGVHLLTCVTPCGAISGYGIAPGNTKEQPLAETFFAARAGLLGRLPSVGRPGGGTYVVDRGFEGAQWHARWASCYGATVVARPKRTAPVPWPPPLRRWHAGLRQIVESVHDRLLTTFGLEHERPHTLPGLRARLAAKVALHNMCLWLNVHLGRPPLAVADLIEW